MFSKLRVSPINKKGTRGEREPVSIVQATYSQVQRSELQQNAKKRDRSKQCQAFRPHILHGAVDLDLPQVRVAAVLVVGDDEHLDDVGPYPPVFSGARAGGGGGGGSE